uniref:Uncharacterized protein n=1 Tax=Anopheles merus TaxID=30066 RepID=A0A182UXD0_ANOME
MLRGQLNVHSSSDLRSDKDEGPTSLLDMTLKRYDHARHDPNEFGEEEYQSYQRLLKKLSEA